MKNKLKKIVFACFSKWIKQFYFKNQLKLNWSSLSQFNFEPEILVVQDIFNDNNNGIFFDVGANKGEYVFALEKIIPKDNIHAFEPNPNLYFKLKHLFKKSNINQLALSNQNGEAKLKVPFLNQVEDDSLGTLRIEEKEPNETRADFYEIKTMTLDRYCYLNNVPRLDCIKIDVEGFELNVLDGGKETIKVHQPVLIIEIEKRQHPDKKVIDLVNEIISKFSIKRKYIPYFYNYSEKKLVQLTDEPTQEIKDWGTKNYINNFIFIPKGHYFHLKVENIKSF
jgi:FkbM family methyltransferase